MSDLVLAVRTTSTIAVVINRGEKGDPGVGGTASVDQHNISPISHLDLRTAIGNKASPYVHIQSTLSTTWLINHNLGRKPSISATTSSGNQVWGGVVHHSPFNSSTITFAIAIDGEAYCI